MSAVLQDQVPQPASGLAHVIGAWRSLRRRELIGFALAGLLFGLLDLSSLLEFDVGDRLGPVVARHLLVPMLASLLLLVAWLPADRSAAPHPRRNLRLALATLLGAALAIVVVELVTRTLPWPAIWDLMREKKGLPPYPRQDPLMLAGDLLWVLMPSAMMVGVMELLARRRRSEASVQRMLAEHSQLRRRAMAARLATLQAQVEPELLFDALVDIERAYGAAEPEAAAQMERLIRHLRVALPRLRESGASLESEADLLESYLDVLRGLHKTPRHFEARWPEALRGAIIPPMLLLPLLQRALRLAADQPPTRCTLTAAPQWESGLRLELAFDRPGLCGADAELNALIERLRVLSGGTARLNCQTVDGGTLFTLELQA